jgi:hypothetical protein
MRRFIAAVLLGVIVEVAVLYALFDQRITFQISQLDRSGQGTKSTTN